VSVLAQHDKVAQEGCRTNSRAGYQPIHLATGGIAAWLFIRLPDKYLVPI